MQPFKQPIVSRPRFMQKTQELSATERGTAMHTVMQQLAFTKVLSAEEVEDEVEKLVEREFLTRDEAAVIDFDAIASFYESEMGQRMMEADRVYREVPFSLALPANEVYADWQEETDEKVFIQGVIDLIIPGEEGWIILDYKTDQVPEPVTDQVSEKLTSRYATQLSLYAEALERIWNKPVEEKYLYFFNGSLLTKVD